MPVSLDDFIKILAQLCEERNLRVAVSESVKGGLITGTSAALGGLLLGPVGLAIGGALGGGLTALSSKGKFQSVAVVITRMNHSQKQKLYEHVHRAFQNVDATDIIALSSILLSRIDFQEVAIGVVKQFVNKELSLQILP